MILKYIESTISIETHAFCKDFIQVIEIVVKVNDMIITYCDILWLKDKMSAFNYFTYFVILHPAQQAELWTSPLPQE